MAGINLFKSCRKIIGAAKAYKDGNPPPVNPIIFLKAPSSLLPEGEKIKIPEGCTQINHEVELGVVIGKAGSKIPESEAMNHVAGYVLALDMTSGDHFIEAQNSKLPWLMAKCFDTFCPISSIISTAEIPDPSTVSLWLKVNGEQRQSANTKDLVFSVPQLISFSSKVMTLEVGDLLLTGTPAGVGVVKSGDVIDCGFEGVKSMKFQVE